MSVATRGAAPQPLLVRVEEAAEMLGLGRTRVYQLMDSGEIASVKIGRSRRIAVAELERFVEERTAVANDDA